MANDKRYRKIIPHLREYLPTFCWQTEHEILTFLEQIDEDVNPSSLPPILWYLARRGDVEYRSVKTRGFFRGRGDIYEYRRVA